MCKSLRQKNSDLESKYEIITHKSKIVTDLHYSLLEKMDTHYVRNTSILRQITQLLNP